VAVTKLNFQLGGTLTLVPEATGYALITVRYGGFTLTARGDDMAYTLPADMQVQVQVTFVDASGNPATVDGAVTWDSSDATGNMLTVTVDPTDDTLATVAAPGQLGAAQVSCTADADLGDGVTPIVTTMDVTVVAGAAVAGTITPVGSPVPIPPPA
jgi:hypothetical protein